MTTVTIETAQKELPDLIKRVLEGEDIVITDASHQQAVRLSLVENKPSYRGRGCLKGKIRVSDDDLFGPLPEDEVKRWWGEDT